ncbi:MAG: TIR domain-containing protein [Vicinamibacteraceae bacterium]|nr:TIR domain-containing protein [Vicinamibacteraceae bacterium]
MIIRTRRTRPFQWLRLAMERGQIAGRVQVGQTLGSGFLMDGALLGEGFAGLPFFFTARHVVPGPHRSLPADVTVRFDALTDDPLGGTAKVERLLTTSRVEELNYSVALLDRWPGHVSPVNLCPRAPAPGDLVFVLGFPGGRGLEVSLDDNEVVATDATGERPALQDPAHVLSYTAPTEPGSSGSAVFNENWELAAIHMGAIREPRVNFGARIHAVVDNARANLEDLVLEEAVIARVKTAGLEAAAAHAAGAPAVPAAAPGYASVFISYSHVDSVFADRLFNSLRAEGIRAWYDKQNILPGYDIYDEITKGVREQDKVLFCFSDAAIKSGWVDGEIDRALQKERDLFRMDRTEATPARRSRSKPLIPLDLDGRLIEGRWESGKAPDLMSRGIADFRNWQDQSTFNAAFERLVAALRTEP